MSFDNINIQLKEGDPVKLISQKSAMLAFATALTSLILILALHFIKPELEPSWHMVSEYSIGNHGWIMKLAFFAWAISCISLVASIRSQIKTTGGKIGLVLLFLVGISLITAGIFVMDSPTASKDEMTTHGSLHGLSAMIGIPGLPVAALLISISLGRNHVWSSEKKSIIRSAHFTWVSLILMLASMFLMFSKTEGKFSPDSSIGWFNRLLIFAYCFWLIIVARNAERLSKQHTISENSGYLK